MITKVEPYFTASPSNVSIHGESCPFDKSFVVWYTDSMHLRTLKIQMFADVFWYLFLSSKSKVIVVI